MTAANIPLHVAHVQFIVLSYTSINIITVIGM